MDPISLIIAALIAGATSGIAHTADQSIKDACQSLKGLVQRRFKGRPEAEVALVQLEKDPEVWKVPVRDALQRSGSHEDTAILRAAQEVMSLIDPTQAIAGKYNIQISGNVQGLAQGDYQKVEMSFTEGPGIKE